MGEVARQDLVAPYAVNTSETERLREEAARQKLLEVQDDPVLINPAVVMIVEENVTGVLNLLRQDCLGKHLWRKRAQRWGSTTPNRLRD